MHPVPAAVGSWKPVPISPSPSYCQLTLFLASPALATAEGGWDLIALKKEAEYVKNQMKWEHRKTEK